MPTLARVMSRGLIAGLLVAGSGALLPLRARGPLTSVPAHPDDRTIVHVLNRIGFGPRPGDVERVRTIGLDAYIDQQLHPDRIDDVGMAARLAPLTTLTKSSREIAEQYIMPAQMLRLQQRQQNGQPAQGGRPSPRAGTPVPQDPAMQPQGAAAESTSETAASSSERRATDEGRP